MHMLHAKQFSSHHNKRSTWTIYLYVKKLCIQRPICHSELAFNVRYYVPIKASEFFFARDNVFTYFVSLRLWYRQLPWVHNRLDKSCAGLNFVDWRRVYSVDSNMIFKKATSIPMSHRFSEHKILQVSVADCASSGLVSDWIIKSLLPMS